MHLPEALIASLRGTPGFREEAFRRAHEQGSPVISVRCNPFKYREGDLPVPAAGPVPWCPAGDYLPERPAFFLDPLWHAGVYYVQEASSMSIGFAVRQLSDLSRPLRALDLCAAPGGKSTLLAALLSPGSLLVSNEVIGSRVAMLEENLTKWGTPNVVITRSDPRDFSRLPRFFDLIVVDAPCSGSGLFRKDPEAARAWTPALVQLCSGRQRRILSDVLPSLAPGGILLYSTCSFSPEEDEAIADYLAGEGLESVEVPFRPEWQIVQSPSPRSGAAGYRFYPGRLAGEGFYLACFRKPGEQEPVPMRGPKGNKGNKGRKGERGTGATAYTPATRAEAAAVLPWTEGSPAVLQYRGQPVLFPGGASADLGALESALRIVSAGTPAGKVIRGQLVPSHALAMSILAGRDIPREELDREQALAFLRKEDTGTAERKGWLLACWRGHPLGWLKGIPRGFHNYYPASWRIRRGGSGGSVSPPEA